MIVVLWVEYALDDVVKKEKERRREARNVCTVTEHRTRSFV